jgi:malonyl-CoA O-methyltransferase
MPVLDPARAYALWAPDYDRETAVSLLEDRLVAALTPSLVRRRLLDVGCGTGRRMLDAGAMAATGVEPCREMIAAGAPALGGRSDLTVLEGEAGALPVPGGLFDVVWCRLVLGHVDDLAAPYREMKRALADGGTVIVSDFHPAAWAAGHRRTFRGPGGTCEIGNHPYSLADHMAAAAAVGLALVESAEACAGPPVRHLYAEAGRLAAYHDHADLPLVFGLRFERR